MVIFIFIFTFLFKWMNYSLISLITIFQSWENIIHFPFRSELSYSIQLHKITRFLNILENAPEEILGSTLEFQSFSIFSTLKVKPPDIVCGPTIYSFKFVALYIDLEGISLYHRRDFCFPSFYFITYKRKQIHVCQNNRPMLFKIVNVMEDIEQKRNSDILKMKLKMKKVKKLKLESLV